LSPTKTRLPRARGRPPPTPGPPARPNGARRVLGYILAKLDEEPLRHRAELYEDLAAFIPDEGVSRQLLAPAQALRHSDRQAQMLRLALR
jgi:hypothetical protein